MSRIRNAFVAAFIVGIFMLQLAPTSAQQAAASTAESNGQIIFVMPSHNVECTYTPAGGTSNYKPFDGGPELNCDRPEPKYVRLVLTPKSVKRFDDAGDQGCCGTRNPFPYGSQ